MPGVRNSFVTLEQRLEYSENGCWVWRGCRYPNGYGRVSYAGQAWYVHRLFYVVTHGEVGEGLELDHLCRNPACCNPDHLEAVPHQVNAARGLVGQWGRQKTQCPKGHAYTTENTRTYRGGRKCRECDRLRKDRQPYHEVVADNRTVR